MHDWPPTGPTKGTKQLVLPKTPQGVVCIYPKLRLGHKEWDVHPMLGGGGHGQEKDLQFIAACPIHLPQPFNSAGLIHILG